PSKPPWFDRIPWRWTIAAPRFGYLLAVLMLLGGILAVLARPYHAPSGSMSPTIMRGDHFFVNTIAYGVDALSDLPFNTRSWVLFGREPRRGDVVLHRTPRDWDIVYVKRVV